jgi:hypothetical protein
MLLQDGCAVLGLGVFLVLALPWMMRLLPHHVRVTEFGIGLISGGTRIPQFSAIHRGFFAIRNIDGMRFTTLVLELKNERVEIGLAASPSVAELSSILSARGVPLGPQGR